MAYVVSDEQAIAGLRRAADDAKRYFDERGEPYTPQLQSLIAYLEKHDKQEPAARQEGT